MFELQTVSLIFLKISVNDLSSGVRNTSRTVTSKIFSLQPSQNMGAQCMVKSGAPVRNTGFYPHKNLLAHSPDFFISLVCSRQRLFCRLSQVEGRLCLCL